MPFVPARCPKCNGTLEIDDKQEAAICEYCGTPFIVEKAINNYTINHNYEGANITIQGVDGKNLIELAKESLEIGKVDEALDYINRALETDISLAEAWYLKMLAIRLTATLGDLQINEMISYASNAIRYAKDKEKMTADVYKYYFERTVEVLRVLKQSLEEDLEELKALMSQHSESRQQILREEIENREFYHKVAYTITELHNNVPVQYISENEVLQKLAFDVAVEYCAFVNSDLRRRNIASFTITENDVKEMKSHLEKLKVGLPEELADKVPQIIIPKEAGCYIATCVYGSYDCPEVWTLRRFRDYTLDKTWYGKLFIKCYYATSPSIVKWLGNTRWFKTFWKSRLDKMVANLNAKGVEDTLYIDKY